MDPDFSDGKYLSFLATVDEEGKPRVRPVMGILVERKIYFSTKTGANKVKEMALNPPVELLIPNQGEGGLSYVRFSGEAFRIFDEKFLQAILERFSYSPDRFTERGKDENICMFELIPLKINQYLPDEKREHDVTHQFLPRRNRE